jgi:hypothetical protein
MVARRIIVAFVATVALLAAAHRLTSGKPENLVVRAEGMTLRHRTVTQQVGPGQPKLVVRVEPVQRLGMVVRWVAPPSSGIESRSMVSFGEGRYQGYLPAMPRGTRIRYWITARNVEQTTARIPGDPGRLVTLKYKGKASPWVIGTHVAFMFAAFFFMVLTLFGAIRMLRGREGKRGTVRSARWVLLFSFMGTWPLGLALNYQTFGVLWQGFPFGSDVTDNKTQLMFVFWLAVLLLVRGSFMGKGEERDRIGPKTFAWGIVVSFVLSLALFILPHSM